MNRRLKTKRDYIIYFSGVIIALPFLGSGVLVAGLLTMWLTGTKLNEQASIWFMLLYLALMPFGVIAGALIADVIWMFILSHFASAEEMRRWSNFNTTYIPLFTPASKAIDEFFIQRKAQRE